MTATAVQFCRLQVFGSLKATPKNGRATGRSRYRKWPPLKKKIVLHLETIQLDALIMSRTKQSRQLFLIDWQFSLLAPSPSNTLAIISRNNEIFTPTKNPSQTKESFAYRSATFGCYRSSSSRVLLWPNRLLTNVPPKTWKVMNRFVKKCRQNLSALL